MPDDQPTLTAHIAERISDIDAADWDACVAGTGRPRIPFIGHTFLQALEESGCVGNRTGWQPRHVLVKDADGTIVAAAPLYVKSHSQGEYVFDHAWAHAFERAGGHYYPKLQCAVPFTPVTSPRLLIRPDAAPGMTAGELRATLGRAMSAVTDQSGVSSLHVTFCTEEDADALEDVGYLIRHDHQFHWSNQGYADFDDFLGSLTSRRRKNIRKERKKVADAGIRMLALTGDDITADYWDAFYRFYTDTYDRKWGAPYLTRGFFALLQERMAEDIVLFIAELEGHPIAGALNFRGEDALIGRNWGCDLRFKFLHFEACYYSAIDYAIAHGIQRVEAGTRGPHKLQRGYAPTRTYSAHWIEDPNFRRAVSEYLEHERSAEAQEVTEIAEYLPYRQENGSSDASS
jgi:predicted N-acyltransferase